MPGFRFRINDPPVGPQEPRIHLFKLFLPGAAFFLIFGAWAAWHYFQIHAPADNQLRALPLRNVVRITESYTSYDSNKISSIELQTADGHSIYYNAFWPDFAEVHAHNTNFSLLVNSTNQIWALRTADGTVVGRDFFRKRNLEEKSIDAFCALLFLPFGVCFLIGFWAGQRAVRTGAKLPPDAVRLISVRKLTLIGFLAGYLIVFGGWLGPWLMKFLPGWSVGLIWVLSAGLIGNYIVRYFQKRWPPAPGA